MTSWSPIHTEPLSASIVPAIMLISVDFPDPFSPARQWMERSSTARVTFLSTATSVNDLEIFSARIEAKDFRQVGRFSLLPGPQLTQAALALRQVRQREPRSSCHDRLKVVLSQIVLCHICPSLAVNFVAVNQLDVVVAFHAEVHTIGNFLSI